MEVNQHRTGGVDLGAIEHNYRVICEQAQAPVRVSLRRTHTVTVRADI
ncbi:MAG: hypothetical protein ACLSGI_06860 [Butyricicoccaceae bacterium]